MSIKIPSSLSRSFHLLLSFHAVKLILLSKAENSLKTKIFLFLLELKKKKYAKIE